MSDTPILSQAQVIALAFQTAGPGADEKAIADEVTRILSATGTGSPVLYAFEQHAKRAENIEDIKTVLGTLTMVDVENTSQRGVLFVKSDHAHAKWNPEGKELARTERIDGKGLGKPLLQEAGKLIGHKVAITVEVQTSDSGKNRVAVRISDRGIDPEYEAGKNTDAYTPDTSKIDVKKLRYGGSLAALEAARAAAAQG